MSCEERVKAEPCAGTFDGCLVEGNAEEKARGKKIKRRALGISVALQGAGLAALVIAPLFAKPAELTERIAVPIPPYRHSAAPRNSTATQAPRQATGICLECALRSRPETGRTSPPNGTPVDPPAQGIEFVDGPNEPSLNPIFDPRTQPARPEAQPENKRVIHLTHIDPALLTRRVEPVYPPLAHQLRKSGRVELHAIIAEDGSIQSLEVVSGDPFFTKSALDAVLQWRYKPTYLNGKAVAIDTFITVIYTLQ